MYLLTVLKANERNEKRWHISGTAGFIYDTNLILNPVAPIGLQVPSNQADFAQTSSITGRYDLVRNDPWVFGAGYNHYNLTYFEHPNESVVAASPLLYGYWNNPPYWAGLEYVYGHYWAGDASKADVHAVYPMFGSTPIRHGGLKSLDGPRGATSMTLLQTTSYTGLG